MPKNVFHQINVGTIWKATLYRQCQQYIYAIDERGHPYILLRHVSIWIFLYWGPMYRHIITKHVFKFLPKKRNYGEKQENCKNAS